MVQHFLHVVQCETTKDGQATVQPEVLRPHQRAGGGGRQDERGEARKCDDGDTGEEGPTEVEILLLLGRRANKGDGAHQTDRVEPGTGEERWLHEHEGREQHGLRDVEGAPESVFLDITVGYESATLAASSRHGSDSLVRIRGHAAVHGADAADKTQAQHHPRIRAHEPEAPSADMELSRRKTDDADAQASVHKRVVEVGALERGHAAIVARVAVEDEVDCDEGCAEDARAVQEALADIALGHGIAVCGLLVLPAEGRAQHGRVSGERRGGVRRAQTLGWVLEWRVVQCADSEGLRGLGCLSHCCRHGERPSQYEGHCWRSCG